MNYFKAIQSYTCLTAILMLCFTTPSLGQWTTSGDDIYNANTGNVGIGATDPEYKLEVNGSIKASAGINAEIPRLYQIDPITSYPIGISTMGSETQDAWDWIRDSSTILTLRNPTSYERSTQLLVSYDSKMYFRKPSSTSTWHEWRQVVTTDGDGNVGIDTDTPDHKLDVNGTARAKEVIVETGWSDFVFEDDYDLRTLAEVEAYIEAHGHLPDIPSAQEVEANGVKVGEIQAKLLQKIEELTLYTIALEKRLHAVESER